ncbi:unnamed protein product [Merluccius merluccius]
MEKPARLSPSEPEAGESQRSRAASSGSHHWLVSPPESKGSGPSQQGANRTETGGNLPGSPPSTERRWKTSTGLEQDWLGRKAAVPAMAECRSSRTGTGGDPSGLTFDQVTAIDPVAESPSAPGGKCPS